MKRILALLIVCAVALTAIAAPAQDKAAKKGAKDRPARQKKGGGDRPGRAKAGGGDQPVRVLLTTGGHAFDQKAFFAMMDSLKGIKYDTIVLPKDQDQLKPGLEQKYDVVLLYDQMKNLTPEQQKNLVALIKDSGIGILSLHHNIGANSGWDEYAEIIGALYIRGPRVIDGVQYTKALSKDGQTLNVHVADPEHFITKGVKDFTVVDEAYDKYYLNPRVHVLLTTEHPLNAKSVAWTTTYGKSPIFYFQLGHDAKAYDLPSFRQILTRGLLWAARERKIMAGAKLEK